MNNNINGNYNMNQSTYTNVDELTHLQMSRRIAERRAQIMYEYEMQQYHQQQEAKAQNDLAAWSESKD